MVVKTDSIKFHGIYLVSPGFYSVPTRHQKMGIVVEVKVYNLFTRSYSVTNQIGIGYKHYIRIGIAKELGIDSIYAENINLLNIMQILRERGHRGI